MNVNLSRKPHPVDMNLRSAGCGKTASTLKELARFMFSRTKMNFYLYTYCPKTPRHLPKNGFRTRTLVYSDRQKLDTSFMIQRSSEKRFFQPIETDEAFERLNQGELCYVSEIDGLIAGYCWIARDKFYIDQIDHAINLKTGDLYLYNAYVLKEYRRYDITTGNIFAARRDLIPQGYRREVIGMMDWNIPSRQFALKLGFEPVGSITVGYILTFRYKINRCKKIQFTSEADCLDFYRRMFQKIRSYINH